MQQPSSTPVRRLQSEIHTLFSARQKNGAAYASEDFVPILDVTGNSVPGRVLAFSTSKLGALSFRKACLLVSNLEVVKLWGLSDRPALFIGVNFPKQISRT